MAKPRGDEQVKALFGAYLRGLRERLMADALEVDHSASAFCREINFRPRRYLPMEQGRMLPSVDWVARLDDQIRRRFPWVEEHIASTAYRAILAGGTPLPVTIHSEDDFLASAATTSNNRPAAQPTDDELATDPQELTESDRAAMRAFLQRAEVRLSTIHRVAVNFLGGAGLLLLFPVLLRDGFPKLYRALVTQFTGGASGPRVVAVLLAVPAVLSVVLAGWALWLLLADLTAFYFTSQTSESATERGRKIFHPRFVLPGLSLPEDEASAAGVLALDEARTGQTSLRTLFPDDDRFRKAQDMRVARIWNRELHLPNDATGDNVRRQFLKRMVSAWDRGLAEEVAHTEAVMTHHLLGVRILVLRYMKALLMMLASGSVTLLSSGIIDAETSHEGAPSQRTLYLLALLFVVWSPAAATAVTAPVRWMYRRFPVGATEDIYRDDRLVQFENLTVVLCAVGGLLASVALVMEASALGGVWWASTALAGVAVTLVWVRVRQTWRPSYRALYRALRGTVTREPV